MFPNWDWTFIAIAASFHALALLSTVFRLWYRWHTARMWWDDAWAAVALLADVASLTAALLQQPIPHATSPRFFTVGNWLVSFAYPTLMWATRISILVSMVRVSQPQDKLRSLAIGVGTSFGIMGVAMLTQRIQSCTAYPCLITRTILISQTATDCIADLLLTLLPIWFLRKLKLNRPRKILIHSAFSASMAINIVTGVQAVVLFQSITSGSVIFGHVKMAFSLMVCNLLVIVTFVYRILRKGETGLDDPVLEMSMVEFTTVDLAQAVLSQEMSKDLSLSGHSASSTWSFRVPGRSTISSTVT